MSINRARRKKQQKNRVIGESPHILPVISGKKTLLTRNSKPILPHQK